MAIYTTIDVGALDTNIVRIEAAVPPPFGRAEDPNDRCRGGDRKVGRAGVAAYIDGGRLRELVKTLQAWFRENNAFRS